MAKLNIAYLSHQLAINFLGGAETQILKSKEYLNQMSCEVKLFDMWDDNINNYDIIHIFNPNRFPVEASEIMSKCHEKDIKVAVSPIFWNSPYESNKNIKSFFWSLYLKSIKTPLLKNFTSSLGTYQYKKTLFDYSNIILPNTKAELSLIREYYDIKHDRFSLIPNGVDSKFKEGNHELFMDKYGLEDFVLYVGGIYKRKNVLNLIKAFVKSEIDTKLVIIGRIYDMEYYKLCRKESNENVIFIPPLLHDSELLKSAYKASKVLALPSYFETPGLAALEGGLAGSNVIITEIGGTKEYFDQYAWYVNPLNENELIESIISAYNNPKTNKLSKHIEKNFTWEKVAEKNLNVYKNL